MVGQAYQTAQPSLMGVRFGVDRVLGVTQ
jgi:WD40 repeat protein